MRAVHIKKLAEALVKKLNLALEVAEAAWAECAAQVDMILACQQSTTSDEKAR